MAAALLLLLFLYFFHFSVSLSDSESLLNLKKSLIHTGALDSWVPGEAGNSPCDKKKSPWTGVVCASGVVIGLRLSHMGLSGDIDVDALRQIPGIRTLSFVNNSFSGHIPPFNVLGALKSLFLSGNKFSGDIPADYFESMASLKKLWLSGNNFSGPIPESIAGLPHLVELHLDSNRFSGPIPPAMGNRQPTLRSLDLSNNGLDGLIPPPLERFGAGSFQGNDGLCGKLVDRVCAESGVESVVPSSSNSSSSNSSKVGIFLIGIIIAIIAAFALSSLVAERRREHQFNILERDYYYPCESSIATGSRRKSSRRGSQSGRNGSTAAARAMGGCELVMIGDEVGEFGLGDLMKASAEVLGNGGLGSAYKAVMATGATVVVKRLREMNQLEKEGFDAEIRRIGRLSHPNVLSPVAYHFRKEEKLLISKYIPNGSLLYVLHGDRGACHAGLNWSRRLKIIQGIARGLGYLHSELPSYKLPHGNLKSCNVLLDSNYEPLLTDYAFYPLITPSHDAAAPSHHPLFAFKAPEAAQQVTPKSDIFCLGVVILELLSGKFPSQYLSTNKGGTDVVQWAHSVVAEKREAEFFDPEIANSSSPSLDHQMEELLRVAAKCTESNPEKRLHPNDAIRSIEQIMQTGT